MSLASPPAFLSRKGSAEVQSPHQTWRLPCNDLLPLWGGTAETE